MTEASDRITQPTKSDVAWLCSEEREWCVSMYVPIRSGFGEIAQNAIRLKNLVRMAEKRLQRLGLAAEGRKRLLSPINEGLLSGRPPRLPSGGLAAFLTPDEARFHHLPEAPDELLHIGSRFHVRPVLDAVADDRMCIVLALGLDGVRLFECTRLGTATLDIPDIPASLEQSRRFDVVEPHRQYHSGSSRRGGGQGAALLVHGQGGGSDQARVKKQIMEYFRQVAAGVGTAIADRSDPLVLVGPPHLVGLYREANRYPHLHEEAVLTDPNGLEPAEVCEKVLRVLEPGQTRRREKLIDKFGTIRSANPDRTAVGLEDVLTAAARGRIATLIVARGKRAWGQHAEPDRAVIHARKKAGDEDLIDRAAWYTLRQGGAYRPVEPDEVPGGGPTAAILRY